MTGRTATRSVCWVVLVVCLLSGIQAKALPIEVSVATDKPVYVPGELLIVGVTAYNPNPTDIILHFPSSEQAWYSMDWVYDNRGPSLPVLTDRLIPAFGSYTWKMNHNWSEYNLSLGTHSVVGNVVGLLSSISSEPFSFDVVAPTLPTTDFTIDFTNLPDGRTLSTGGSLLNAYAAWGVHFGTFKNGGMQAIGVGSDGDNQYATVNSTSYPPGFNIQSWFDMPVYQVAAEVSSAAGVAVTMVAKDADGQVVASVTSDAVPQVREFVGPLELASSTPIASVEWWPSNDHAGVMVDNLFVGVTIPPLPGDLNGDGFVGVDDLNIVLGAWNSVTTLGGSLADASGDGFVGIADLNTVLGNWNAGTQPASAAPEPGMVSLMLLCVTGLTHRRATNSQPSRIRPGYQAGVSRR